ncbi:hypothetical protein ACWDYH_31110 [Nocardia goodfellowii]
MFRRFTSRIARGLPREIHTLRPPHRVAVLVLVFLFYTTLAGLGVAPVTAIGVVAALGVVAAKIITLLDGDDVPGPARA